MKEAEGVADLGVEKYRFKLIDVLIIDEDRHPSLSIVIKWVKDELFADTEQWLRTCVGL